jgi:hypothetical protein
MCETMNRREKRSIITMVRSRNRWHFVTQAVSISRVKKAILSHYVTKLQDAVKYVSKKSDQFFSASFVDIFPRSHYIRYIFTVFWWLAVERNRANSNDWKKTALFDKA